MKFKKIEEEITDLIIILRDKKIRDLIQVSDCWVFSSLNNIWGFRFMESSGYIQGYYFIFGVYKNREEIEEFFREKIDGHMPSLQLDEIKNALEKYIIENI